MGRRRAQKIWKLNYWRTNPEFAAQISLLADPAEVRVSASEDTFIGVRGGELGGLSFSPGVGNSISIQGMSGSMRYAGLLQDLPFPASIIPTTPLTPFPKQIISPPLLRQMPLIQQMALIASSYVGA